LKFCGVKRFVITLEKHSTHSRLFMFSASSCEKWETKNV